MRRLFPSVSPWSDRRRQKQPLTQPPAPPRLSSLSSSTTTAAATPLCLAVVKVASVLLLALVTIGPFLALAIHGPDETRKEIRPIDATSAQRPGVSAGGGGGGGGGQKRRQERRQDGELMPPERIREQLRGFADGRAGREVAAVVGGGHPVDAAAAAAELNDPKYGTVLPLGRAAFESSPGCKRPSQIDANERSSDNVSILGGGGGRRRRRRPCIIYNPEAELSDHLPFDEAYVLARRLMDKQAALWNNPVLFPRSNNVVGGGVAVGGVEGEERTVARKGAKTSEESEAANLGMGADNNGDDNENVVDDDDVGEDDDEGEDDDNDIKDDMVNKEGDAGIDEKRNDKQKLGGDGDDDDDDDDQDPFSSPVPPHELKQPSVIGRGGSGNERFPVTVEDGIDEDFAALTRHGYKGGLPGSAANQDRILIVAPFRIDDIDNKGYANGDDDDDDDDDEDGNFLMAIFDGHGDRGHATSQKVVSDFPSLLASRLHMAKVAAIGGKHIANKDGNDDVTQKVKEALDGTYKELNMRVNGIKGSGCTASTILKLGNTIYVANAGDSTSLVVTRVRDVDIDDAGDVGNMKVGAESGAERVQETELEKRTAIAYRNREDKPHLPDELDRIRKSGGEVMIPPEYMQPPPGSRLPRLSSRVYAMLDNGMQLALAMSRSIGDPEANLVGVIPDPIIDVIDVAELVGRSRTGTNEKRNGMEVGIFALVASDGLFDHLPEEDVVEQIGDCLFGTSPNQSEVGGDGKGIEEQPRPRCLLETMESLIMKSSRNWIRQGTVAYRDDISIAVARVKV